MQSAKNHLGAHRRKLIVNTAYDRRALDYDFRRRNNTAGSEQIMTDGLSLRDPQIPYKIIAVAEQSVTCGIAQIWEWTGISTAPEWNS